MPCGAGQTGWRRIAHSRKRAEGVRGKIGGMTVRFGIGKVKSSSPEQFTLVWMDFGRGAIQKMAFMSEVELRAWLTEKIHSEPEINSIIEQARKDEV